MMSFPIFIFLCELTRFIPVFTGQIPSGSGPGGLCGLSEEGERESFRCRRKGPEESGTPAGYFLLSAI
jgi:hypothetical protein